MKTLIILLMMTLPFLCPAQEKPPESWEIFCNKVKDVPIPTTDQPKKSEVDTLGNCDSEALYYGIGQPTDYNKARHCAYVEREKGDGKVFGGSAILMMIYANGLGVIKNIPLAERFACALSAAPAEMNGRIEHLEKLKTATPQEAPFDLCDDITSGYMAGFCTKHSDRMAQLERGKTLKKVIDRWTVAEKAAFEKLQKASDHFTEARVQNEVDQSGTMRGTFMIEERAIQEKDFIESLEKLETKKAPQYSAAQHKEEDRKLNALYQQIQKKKNQDWGTVTPEGIKKAQRAWIEYRDAWVEFAKIKYPAYSPHSISAWFTKKRNHMLRSILK